MFKKITLNSPKEHGGGGVKIKREQRTFLKDTYYKCISLLKIYFLELQLTRLLYSFPPSWEGFSHPRMLSSKLAWNLKMLRTSSIVLKIVEQM